MTSDNRMVSHLAKPPNERDRAFMRELLESGKVISVIDRHYTLDEVSEALLYVGEGHARGKVIITRE